MEDRSGLYLDFSKGEKDSAICFLLNALIRSREKCGFCSNEPEFDEDVNIYLAYLLFAISTSAYQNLAHRYVAFYTTDVTHFLENTEDNYTRYFIYRINADNLLLYLTIFEDFLKAMISEKRILRISEEAMMETAQAYYERAAVYNQRIYRRRTAVGDVLTKLARHFDRYCAVLQMMRRDFFQLMDDFDPERFSRFVQELSDCEKQALLKEKQDAFLDLYLLREKDKANDDLKAKIDRLCAQIRVLDPEFRFKSA